MTVRKKLTISNVLMIVIPVVLAVMFSIIAFTAYGNQYWDSLEEIYNDENGVYSAQSIINACKEELMKREWHQSGKITKLEGKLDELGYHFRVKIAGKEEYSSLAPRDEEKIKEYFRKSYDGIGSLTMSDEDGAVIKSTFQTDRGECEIVAVCMADRVVKVHTVSYLKRYVLSFLTLFVLFVLMVIAVTNLALSRWITHVIMTPLRLLKDGTKEVAEGNLDFRIDYDKKDEFGEVCQEFDEMRGRLKESVDIQIAYERYKRELIAGISHDLRTPLTSIKGYVEGLQDGIANTEEKRERYYNAIHTRALDMEALINSLSTFAKLENKQYKYQLETVDVDEYFGQLIRDYKEEAERKNAVILYNNYAGSIEISLDIQEMRRAFVNLFENSIKYRVKNETVIRIEVRKLGKSLRILVADDGPGVPERELSSIFHTFYRGDESRTKPESGSGLGLAIVKQIIEGHHGTIRACNDKGLAMEIILPIKQQRKEAVTDEEDSDCRR